MKALKIVGLALGGVLLVVGAVLAYLVSSFDGPRMKQELAAMIQAKTGRVLRIEGDLALSVWPNLGVRLGKLSLSEPDGRQVFAQLEQARVAVAVLPLLSRQIVVQGIAVDGLHAKLVKGPDGHLNIDDLMGGSSASPEAKAGAIPETKPDAAPTVDVASVQITRGQVDWLDQQAGKHLILSNLDLSSGRLQLASGQLQVADFKVAAKGKLDADSFSVGAEIPKLAAGPQGVRGEWIKVLAGLQGQGKQVTATVTVKGVAGTLQALQVEQFALDGEAVSGETRVVAQLASPVRVDALKTTVSLPQLTGKLEVAAPQLPMKSLSMPLSGQAEAHWGKPSAQVALATQLDGSHLQTRVTVPTVSPLALVFAVDIDQLDLDKYLPPAPAGRGASAGGEVAKAPAEGKINLAGLKGLNLQGDVRIGQLTARKLKASALSLHLVAQGGRVQVSPLAANLYEGRLEGALGVDAHSNQFTIRQTLSGIQINPLLKDLASKDMLEGRGNVVVDVTTRGETVSALKKALGGSLRLALSDGAIKGINLGQKLREAKGLLQGGKAVSVAGDSTQKTDFSELSASFRINGGVAHNDDLMAKSPLLRLTGNGDIDIGNERLDYLLKTSVVNTATGQGGKEMDTLKGITVPVRLSGSFAQPAWNLELGGMLQEAAKAKLDEQKEALKQKAADQAKEQLKGQLKGLLFK